jgi:hypothetical protein
MFITGVLIVIFAILAGLNMMPKYTDLGVVKWIASKHKIFGMLSVLTAIIHFIIAISNQDLRITGLLVLISLISTGILGILFYRLKNNKLFLVHKVMALMTFLLIIVHVIFN